jgi:hypothetical protein
MAWTKKTNIKGPKGDDGIRGTKIFSSAAAPTDSDKANKINGDKWIDLSTMDLYELVDNSK